MKRLIACAGLIALLSGCTTTIERRPTGPMVATRSSSEAIFAPLDLGGASGAEVARRDAGLSPRAESTDIFAEGQRADLRGARRVRISTDPATHTYFSARRRFGDM